MRIVLVWFMVQNIIIDMLMNKIFNYLFWGMTMSQNILNQITKGGVNEN
jgi:hypothetical protein